MKTQTAVDVLSSFLKTHCNPSVCDIEWSDLETSIREAKAMEKEQIEKAFDSGSFWTNKGLPANIKLGELYYNETFGGDK